MKKVLEFKAKISEVEQINPLFSTCKVRVLYLGKNRNMSTLTKDAVEKAIPTLKNIPIVGEFAESAEDFKGHGGAIDLDTWDYIHTTKPYGVVPESATYEWEEVNGKEYLTINGCYLWTGRYEEAETVIRDGKGQSMEIEIVDGDWDDEEESYIINNFTFSALCILGDNVEPAFEDASITAYSFDKDEFKAQFSIMLDELQESLSSKDKEGGKVLEAILKKYNLTVKDLTDKGIDFDKISIDELESEIVKAFDIVADEEEIEESKEDFEEEVEDEEETEEEIEENFEDEKDDEDVYSAEEYNALKEEIGKLEKLNNELSSENSKLIDENEELKEFKTKTEEKKHSDKAQEIFDSFQLSALDVKDIDVLSLTIDEIKEKCYAILGRKLASKKNFSKDKDKEIRLPIDSDDNNTNNDPYGGLFDKFNKN